MWIEYNPNPYGKRVGDCTVRAIAKATGQSWEDTYAALAVEGFLLGDMPSSNSVWGGYLMRNGWERHIVPNTCPDCYTAEDFCRDHPNGTYILALPNHVATIQSGNLYDAWDSSGEIPLYYWKKKG